MPTKKNNKWAEDMLFNQIVDSALPTPLREYKAIPHRKFQWDFAFPDNKLLVEVQGAVWVKGGHSTGVGITRDCYKQCMAAIHGWYTMAVTSTQVKSGEAIELIKEYFG